jgi:transcriptional regulator with XRE-family HTH domain
MANPPNHLKAWRQFCGQTLVEAAARAHCTASTLSKLENGRLRITDGWLHRLAEAYSRSPAALLGPPGQHADSATPPGGAIDPEDAAAMSRLWQSLPPRFRPHLLAIIAAAGNGDVEQLAFLDADIHASDIALALDINLTASQRLHLIGRGLAQRAEREAAGDRQAVVVEQGIPENY